MFLVALGIDYNIFLMTRVREEVHRHGPRRGAIAGLAATGGVITSAGLVLAGTFAVLATLPIVFVVELGFAVAFGVLLDTIIVRAVLVTALNLDLGRWMWWPSKLAAERDPEVEEVPAGARAVRLMSVKPPTERPAPWPAPISSSITPFMPSPRMSGCQSHIGSRGELPHPSTGMAPPMANYAVSITDVVITGSGRAIGRPSVARAV